MPFHRGVQSYQRLCISAHTACSRSGPQATSSQSLHLCLHLSHPIASTSWSRCRCNLSLLTFTIMTSLCFHPQRSPWPASLAAAVPSETLQRQQQCATGHAKRCHHKRRLQAHATGGPEVPVNAFFDIATTQGTRDVDQLVAHLPDKVIDAAMALDAPRRCWPLLHSCRQPPACLLARFIVQICASSSDSSSRSGACSTHYAA